MEMNRNKIELVVLDTAGTFCDGPADLRHRWPEDDLKGCKAPVIPFYEVLTSHGISCSWEIIRRPMGMYKSDHLRTLLNMPEISSQWQERYGRAWNEEDFEKLLEEFKKLMSVYIVDEDLARPIEGAGEAIDKMRKAGIIIGCDTGYYQKDAQALNKVLDEKFGVKFDVSTNSEKVPGRPSPFMIYDCMLMAYEKDKRVIPVKSVVKVDDTRAGILSGNNAGCWTVGLYASGSDDYEKLREAEPDFLVPDISYLPDVIFQEIEPKLLRGEAK